SQPPGLGRERVLGGLDELAERGRIVHGHVGEDLAVDLDPGLAQTVDEPRVRQTVLPRPGPDPRDPQAPELRLAVATVAVSVLARVEELLLGYAVALRARPEIALGLAEHLTALLLRVDRTFDPRHLPYFPRSRRMLVRSAVTSVMPSTRRRRLPLFLRRKWFPVALRWRTLPVRVMRNRLAVARCVFCLGIFLVPWLVPPVVRPVVPIPAVPPPGRRPPRAAPTPGRVRRPPGGRPAPAPPRGRFRRRPAPARTRAGSSAR